MKKRGDRPLTKVKNPEPNVNDPSWIIWAAWADRITFEEIEKRTGKTESEVIKIMRGALKLNSFKLWRKRVSEKALKHGKKFKYSRKEITNKSLKDEFSD
ncbi:TIGR03643 family protein [Candidatus Pelagisphaera phototrophica]|uniref:TIGR03643 family protein n=1 Tax=Candidatus Pelagisphaera phototrophica TaxID=2684113 RepID=UPI0019FD303B|nr:TIGR03643 family protein [Candidatus Pelagisphaera phototrophica]QXD30529.1 TIGR03643 family protein [Candidatus Pelagisphaera phototrophica]